MINMEKSLEIMSSTPPNHSLTKQNILKHSYISNCILISKRFNYSVTMIDSKYLGVFFQE